MSIRFATSDCSPPSRCTATRSRRRWRSTSATSASRAAARSTGCSPRWRAAGWSRRPQLRIGKRPRRKVHSLTADGPRGAAALAARRARRWPPRSRRHLAPPAGRRARGAGAAVAPARRPGAGQPRAARRAGEPAAHGRHGNAASPISCGRCAWRATSGTRARGRTRSSCAARRWRVVWPARRWRRWRANVARLVHDDSPARVGDRGVGQQDPDGGLGQAADLDRSGAAVVRAGDLDQHRACWPGGHQQGAVAQHAVLDARDGIAGHRRTRAAGRGSGGALVPADTSTPRFVSSKNGPAGSPLSDSVESTISVTPPDATTPPGEVSRVKIELTIRSRPPLLATAGPLNMAAIPRSVTLSRSRFPVAATRIMFTGGGSTWIALISSSPPAPAPTIAILRRRVRRQTVRARRRTEVHLPRRGWYRPRALRSPRRSR